MKKRKLFICIILLFAIGNSCQSPKNKEKQAAIKSYIPQYAQFFRIDYQEHSKTIHILNPWGNENLNFEYHIAMDSLAQLEKSNGFSFNISKKPQNIAVFSSPIFGMLNFLNKKELIKGITDPELIYDSTIQTLIEQEKIINIGKSIQINMEKLISLQPDLVMGSGWDRVSADYEKMISLNIIPFLMYDWQEQHPLGKAEWLVLLGALFNEEEQTTEMFKNIEAKYNSLKAETVNEQRPLVFNGSEYQGIWYSAGGKSYISQLYQDAGAQYLMESDSSQGSITLDFEVLMNKAAQADIWMYTGGTNENKITETQSPKYQGFKAVQDQQIYSYAGRLNENGANDYFETGSFRPDLVLQDLIRIFHSSNQDSLYYFKRVEF